MKGSPGTKAILLIVLILVLDQALKIWIKTHMIIGQEFRILGDWFIIHFTENNGMAFGMELGGETGKLILSLFRLVAVVGIGWWIRLLVRQNAPQGFVLSLSLIFAGALGNIIDSTFYGVLFGDSYFKVAAMFPEGGGYAPLLHGKVVDMLYFPLITGHFPDWLPVWGGEQFIFFRPVFNIADSAITIGVFIILLFHRKYLTESEGQTSRGFLS